NSIPLSGNIQSKNYYIDTDDWIYYLEQDFPTKLIRIHTDGTSGTTLHTFNAATEGDLGIGVTEIPGDSLFGVQTYGGLNDGGTIYCLLKDGTDFSVQHQFTPATGIHPTSKLAYFDGNLYGTTSAGGDFDKGVLFCIN